ncbi:hypothetical protein EYV94_18135 [Puteibacter caeruleilacunae]|nr:hypothetical protein EYV94_18135 [Puteibacter caeruleilacunae]
MNVKELIGIIRSISFISDVKEVSILDRVNKSITVLISFKMMFNNKNNTFLIGFKNNFPLSKPYIYLYNWNDYGFIPHVDYNGEVCFAHDEGLFLDYTNPKGIIESCVKLAKNTLVKGINAENTTDFLNEFENYFSQNKHIIGTLTSCVEITKDVKVVDIFSFNNNSFIADSKSSLRAYGFNNITADFSSLKQSKKCIYVHINKPIMPPGYDENWTRNSIITSIKDRISENSLRKLNRLLFQNNTTTLLIHFVAPNNTDCLFAINLDSKGFNQKEKDNDIKLIAVRRRDLQYCTQRGGVMNQISNKKVLLIGCGSVGGFIAHNLVKSGVKKLTLVDNDIFNHENIYRHILGVNAVNENKVDALKELLESSTLKSNIEVFKDTIENIINKRRIKLQSFDLIISATGNPTVNLWLNNLLITQFEVPIIFTWVDPYGIGGHSILANNKKEGCYQCLMDENTNHNKAAFYAIDQVFHKTLTSCSSVFTPYGFLDAELSALECSKLALSSLLGLENDNPTISWKGDSSEFIKNGYKLSERFKLTIDQLNEAKYFYKNDKCETCAKR